MDDFDRLLNAGLLRWADRPWQWIEVHDINSRYRVYTYKSRLMPHLYEDMYYTNDDDPVLTDCIYYYDVFMQLYICYDIHVSESESD